MRVFVGELVASIGPEHIKVAFDDTSAKVELCGHTSPNLFIKPIHLSIEPGSDWKSGEYQFVPREGFDVTAIKYDAGLVIPTEDPIEFDDEQAVIDYVVSRAAKNIALIRHRLQHHDNGE